jgi:hypothetical protein
VAIATAPQMRRAWPTEAPPLASWDARLQRLLPFVFAITTGFQVTKYVVVPEGLGFDARLYAAAARAWLEGGDPWKVSDLGIFFAAPPPTLVAFAPFAFLPGAAVSAILIIASSVAAVVAIRSLGLPLWWLAFWPIVDGVLVGNPNVIVLCLLVVARGRLASLATVLKVYAVAPLIGERRLRQLAIALALILASVVVLPWGQWLSDLGSINEHLERTSATTSVFGNPVAMVVGAGALLALGVRRAGWLVVPLLWPSTQPHYMAMSVPMLTPLLAIAWSFPHPYIVLGSVVVAAVGHRLSAPSLQSLHLEPAH